MQMPRRPRILIVGGGIGGLAAALALERQRAEVIVCEQAPKLSEIGAGIGLAPNAVKALRALGLEDKINAAAYASEFAVIRSWRDGRQISRAYQGDYREKFGAPSITIHRADLLGILADALRSTDIRLGQRSIAVAPNGNGAVARFADGTDIEADLVVGADGIHSKVRESLFGADAPRFTGCICFRGMAPAEAVPRDINTGDVTLWMGPRGHVVHYLVRRGELLNIVAHIDSDAWTEESWTRECDVSEVTTTYARRNSALTRVFPASARWYKWALYDRDPPERWSKGRATLLGDSAHAMLPYLGQPRWRSRMAACSPAPLPAPPTISTRRSPPMRRCASRAPARLCSARAPARATITSPRRWRACAATCATPGASASAATRPCSRPGGSMTTTPGGSWRNGHGTQGPRASLLSPPPRPI
jgi:salicylate hydroxylase